MADILELLNSTEPENIKKAHKILSQNAKKDVLNNANEYNNKRDVRKNQVGKRQNKVTGGEVIEVNKIAIPFQRKIVQSASSFLFGSPVNIVPNEVNDLTETILDKWKELRLDATLLKFAEAVKSETEATIIFYEVNKGDGNIKLKSRLLTSKNGKYYPYFDEYGDLTAFGWEYKKTENDKEVVYLYVYTEDQEFRYKSVDGNWQLLKGYPVVNLFGKIPVVYLSQESPEWEYVKDLIDRFEMTFSKFCDTNDYFADPKYVIKGKVYKVKGDSKSIRLEMVQTSDGKIVSGDVSILSWDRAPESLKLEFDTLVLLIYFLSDTTNLTPADLKGLGAMSGVALELMFMGSILKAKWDEGDYSVAISRMLSIIKAGVTNITNPNLKLKDDDTSFEVKFTSVLPKNLKEIVETLVEGSGGKAIISQETATELNPMIKNKDREKERLRQESNLDKVQDLGDTIKY
ncbi:MAG: phage portal protein [Tenacibaculum sp.]|nr:phage portal protein [Tenacibaculum sp.]